MDFKDGKAEHRLLCLDCAEPAKLSTLQSVPFNKTSVVLYQYYWASRLKAFYTRHPIIRMMVDGSYPFFLFLAIGLATSDSSRQYAAIPLALFIISLFLHENVPLALLPAGNLSAVTNCGNKFRGGARLIFVVAMAVVVCSLLLEVLNQYLNNMSFSSTLEARSDRVTKRVATVVLFALPVVYIVYLTVTDTFTTLEPPLRPGERWRTGVNSDRAIMAYVDGLDETAPGLAGDGARKMKTMLSAWRSKEKDT